MILLLLAQLALPNLTRTPGEVRPWMPIETVCSTKWGLDRRHITKSMKRRVANEYGVPWEDRWQYEFDHLVPRQLGGADSVLNLWPQPLAEAHAKDVIENRLHRTVCTGFMLLEDARTQMRQWGRQSVQDGTAGRGSVKE